MYLLVSLFLDKKRYKHILARHNAYLPTYLYDMYTYLYLRPLCGSMSIHVNNTYL